MGKWQKGQSGNPRGRPPKARTLTEFLKKEGSKTVEIDGVRVSGKRLLARRVWEGLNTGKITFQDGTMKLSPQDWQALMKWLYNHVDGPPRLDVDVTSGGEPVKGYAIISPDDWGRAEND